MSEYFCVFACEKTPCINLNCTPISTIRKWFIVFIEARDNFATSESGHDFDFIVRTYVRVAGQTIISTKKQ